MTTTTSERIAIASDHAGFALKGVLATELARLGFTVNDLGPATDASIDYADHAHPLARGVADGTVRRGVLLCGTGLGMSYVANRYPGVRAAPSRRPRPAPADARGRRSRWMRRWPGPDHSP